MHYLKHSSKSLGIQLFDNLTLENYEKYEFLIKYFYFLFSFSTTITPLQCLFLKSSLFYSKEDNIIQFLKYGNLVTELYVDIEAHNVL